MQIYLSGSTDIETEQWFIDRDYNRLFSQLNDRKYIAKYIEMGGDGIILDSGAFSAFNSGKVVDIDDYIQYANSITEHCRFIVNLDVIGGDPKESFDNFVYMRKRLKEPLKLMPVFHSGEVMDWLYAYINYEDEFGGCPSIGLGAVARSGGADRVAFLDLCEKVLDKYPDIWVHAFGVTQAKILKKYSYINSADSIAWLLSAAYRYMLVPHTYDLVYIGKGRYENGRCERPMDKKHFKSEYTHPKVKQSFKDLDIDIDELYGENGNVNQTLLAKYNAYVINDWAENFVPKKRSKVRKLF